jgi:hypothetical protein
VANPLIPQGQLNRVLASCVFANFSSLNVISGNLAEDAISMAPEGPAGDYLSTLTGAVQSPRPYQIYTVTLHLDRAQPIAQAWEMQLLQNGNVGPFTVTPDVVGLGPFPFINGMIMNRNELTLAGGSVEYQIVLRGTYVINNSLFT